jgi:hypothetical protein
MLRVYEFKKKMEENNLIKNKKKEEMNEMKRNTSEGRQ